MTPSLFAGTDAIDEHTFMQTPGAAAKLTQHHQEFITEADFAWIAAHGLNAVRIPVGYWIIDGDAPFAPAAERLEWALSMAQKYGLKVLVDVHGLPGSQNGNDHSGTVGEARWLHDRTLQERSVKYVVGIAERFGSHPSVWGIQVINEPNPAAFQLSLRRYYRRVYSALDRVLSANVRIVYSDAWSPRLLSFALPFKRRAVMDVHLYHMATLGAKRRSLDWFYTHLRRRAKLLKRLSRFHPIIIGEWSGVISHETIGALPAEKQDALFTEYVRMQQTLYGAYAGWFYWSYKTEDPGHWSYRTMVERGMISTDV